MRVGAVLLLSARVNGMAKLEKAMFAAGCFWGVEAHFAKLSGVKSATSGYSGGTARNPTYEQVCGGKTGHAESVLVEFDADRISYGQLLREFFSMHDATQKNRQGPDVGKQYRSAIFYFSERQGKEAEEAKEEAARMPRFSGREIATEITRAGKFWKAEEYHQKYFEKHPFAKVCHF